MPPFIGFLGKLYLILNILKANNFSLVLLLILIASFSAFYYLRILKLIFFEVQNNKKINQIFQGNFLYIYQDVALTALCFVLLFLLVCFFSPSLIILFSKYISIAFFKL
jgi:NADH-quinone oxidoreductase subunit N